MLVLVSIKSIYIEFEIYCMTIIIFLALVAGIICLHPGSGYSKALC